MTWRDLRPLLERPFRHYANFSGRAGRAEFWLFILTFVILTNLASIIGYGGMRLAGYQSHHHQETYHHLHPPSEDTDTNGAGLSHMDHHGSDNPVIFKFHRHSAGEGYHLHGSIDAPYYLDRYYRHGDGDGERHTHGHLQSDEDGARYHFTFDHDERTSAEDGAEAVEGFVMLAMVIPLLAVGARRLHDTNKSGWWQLFVLIPLAGWIVLLIFFLLPGEPDSNRFGPQDTGGA